MSKRTIPETSKEAYRSLDVATLNERYKLIIQALTVLGEATTEEVSAFCRKPHETLWKRFSELSNMGLIYRPGNKRLMKSGRNGFTWSLTNGATPKTSKAEKAMNGKSVSDYSKSLSSVKTAIQTNLFNNV